MSDEETDVSLQHLQTKSDLEAMILVLEAARDILPSVGLFVSQVDLLEDVPLYASKIRLKGRSSLKVKIEKKRTEEDPEYFVGKVTDIIGVRFITLFREDLSKVASVVFRRIAEGGSPFRQRDIEELTVYSSDRAAIEVENGVRAAAVETFGEELASDIYTPDKKESGYSSIHIVARLNAPLADGDLFPSIPNYSVPIEIQIRTVFEDAWGEIDHKYKYKLLESGEDSIRSRNYFVRKHIENLKGLTDSCSQYANLIHQEASSTAEVVEVRTKAELADSDESVLGILRAHGVDKEIVNLVMSKRRDYQLALEQKKSGEIDVAIADLARAADQLREARERHIQLSIADDDRTSRAAFYFLAMEEALCRYATDADSEIEKAIAVYRKVLREVGANAVVHYRLGLAFGALGRYEAAIDSYEQVRRLIEDQESSEPNQPDDYGSWAIDTAKNRLPISFAYTKGQFAKRKKGVDEKFALFEQAFQISVAALDHAEGEIRHKLLNNSLFYGIQAYKTSVEIDVDAIDIGTIRNLLDRLLESCAEYGDLDKELVWHTLMEAYLIIGDRENAERMAAKLAESLDQRQTPLTQNEGEVARGAGGVLAAARRRKEEESEKDPEESEKD